MGNLHPLHPLHPLNPCFRKFGLEYFYSRVFKSSGAKGAEGANITVLLGVTVLWRINIHTRAGCIVVMCWRGDAGPVTSR